MKLTEKQQQLVINKLQNTKKICPSCGNNNLIIGDRIFELREFNGGNLVIGGKESSIYPLIVVACPVCGNIQFFNAILMGVISSNTSKEEPINKQKIKIKNG